MFVDVLVAFGTAAHVARSEDPCLRIGLGLRAAPVCPLPGNAALVSSVGVNVGYGSGERFEFFSLARLSQN